MGGPGSPASSPSAIRLKWGRRSSETRLPRPRTARDTAPRAMPWPARIDQARAVIERLPARDRSYAAAIVFGVGHPVADAGDDKSAGPIMELVIEFQPDNYMALYHAGMSEYVLGQPDPAAKHLRRFLELYTAPTTDGAPTPSRSFSAFPAAHDRPGVRRARRLFSPAATRSSRELGRGGYFHRLSRDRSRSRHPRRHQAPGAASRERSARARAAPPRSAGGPRSRPRRTSSACTIFWKRAPGASW